MSIKNGVAKVAKKHTIKFEELAQEWLNQRKAVIKESTFWNYSFIIKKYLEPRLKGKTLKKLEKIEYNRITNNLTLKLSTKTVRDITIVLKSILRYGNYIYKSKIEIEKIIVPKININNLKILSTREKRRLERSCLKENSLRSMGIILCLNTGMRIGEVCALKWEDIDLEARLIYVRKTLQRVYIGGKEVSKVIIDKPKTRSSIRMIPISSKIYQILAPLKKLYSNEAFFLTGVSEKFLEPRNYQYTYKNLLRKSNIKEYKFHILRHTFASDCIEVGMDTKSLSEILGHADVSITLNRYVHSSVKLKKKYLEKL